MSDIVIRWTDNLNIDLLTFCPRLQNIDPSKWNHVCDLKRDRNRCPHVCKPEFSIDAVFQLRRRSNSKIIRSDPKYRIRRDGLDEFGWLNSHANPNHTESPTNPKHPDQAEPCSSFFFHWNDDFSVRRSVGIANSGTHCECNFTRSKENLLLLSVNHN